MDKTLLLPVDHLGEALEFEMKVQPGFITRAELIVDGTIVLFEPDNEGRYRAIQTDPNKKTDIGLLAAIASQLEILFH